MTHADKISSQVFSGQVVSAKMPQTVVVEVKTSRRHAKYHKAYTVTKRYKAHVESGAYAVGDAVQITACRPVSKDKRFKVVKKV